MLKFSKTKYKDQLLLNITTSKEVAKKTGLTESTISCILRGKSNPKAQTIAKLAEALNCTMLDLLEDVPE